MEVFVIGIAKEHRYLLKPDELPVSLQIPNRCQVLIAFHLHKRQMLYHTQIAEPTLRTNEAFDNDSRILCPLIENTNSRIVHLKRN